MMRQSWVQARVVEITSCDEQVLVAGCLSAITSATPLPPSARRCFQHRRKAPPWRVEASSLTWLMLRE
jgi:hypothetical protein